MHSTDSVIKTFCNERIINSNASLEFPGSGWLTLTVLAPSRSQALQLERKRHSSQT